MYQASIREQQIDGNKHKNEGCEETREQFKNHICGGCKNRRPRKGCKREFTYAELYAATDGFSMKNFLSEGGCGKVYKGQLHGIKIAVKKHKNIESNKQGDKEFRSEVDALSRVRHENVVVMLGSCSEGNHRLLVYEFVCNFSLNQHLHQHCRRPLSWENRVKVAIGAARGLLYLHDNNIIHRDMTPNNILLTHDFETLLGDFGLAITREEEKETASEEECVGGDEDYAAPEYVEDGKLSTKTDVYSFGVVLLQLITGMRTTDKRRLGERSLVEWARPLLRERKCGSVIDKRIREDHDCHQLYWMSRLAQSCLSKNPHKRLTMAQVVEALSHIAEGCKCNDKQKKCSSPYHYDPSSLLISASSMT
ncbi:proline-rich receptor-like protein kinase PERK8 [Neltuma alba]|uniref:proline-rich receptor-like protein kinase PERK8 n=1 Tax=Neltuma alba TaxID=207710 RepID=UPI0010A5809B|nr:proline-rich receptor-like protein kinase PERK8 [Prosopis alba]